jgi:hypothetical protein
MWMGRVALIGMTVMMVGEMRPWSHVVDGQAEPCVEEVDAVVAAQCFLLRRPTR